MADYLVYRNQWLSITLFGGGMLLLMFVLCYWAMWRPRTEEKEAAQQKITGIHSLFSWLHGIAPWAIILAVLGTFFYTVFHTGLAALKTPNW
jgi:type II secretory pathway component PulM